jgi:RNA polymerase sigma-70 factor (ECF subfamily)
MSMETILEPELGPPPSGDDALLAGLRAGEGSAYEAMVRREAPRLLAVARRMLRNEEDARDTVQDAFVSAFRAFPTFKETCRLSTWLHRITVNAALMRLRTRRRKPEEAIDDLLPGFLEDGHHVRHPPEWREEAFETLTRREDRDFVRAAIDRLPETYRTVLLLRDIEELDTAEAARALGVTETVVKVRLHRARQALRTLLEPRFRKSDA